MLKWTSICQIRQLNLLVESEGIIAQFTGGVINMTTIIETKRLRFKRLPYAYVSGYEIYLTYGNDSERYLGYVENSLEPSPEECLERDVDTLNGCISLPKTSYRDKAYPPMVLLNDRILTESEYTYHPHLNQIKLVEHLKIEEQDVLDLIYYQDLIVYEHLIEHLCQIEPTTYRVVPIYWSMDSMKDDEI